MLSISASMLVLSILAVNGLAQSHSPPNATGNYLVAIRVNNTRVYDTDVNWFKCGGSIIDDRFIITAARCFINEDNQFEKLHFTVLTGAQNLLYKTESTRVEVGVEKVYVPDNYRGGRFNPWNNLAVVKLNKSLDLEHNQGLRKLRLPDGTRSSKVGDKVVLSGYGIEKMIGITYIDPLENDLTVENMVYGEDGIIHPGNAEIVDNGRCDGISCVHVVNSDENEQCLSDTGGPIVYESDILIGVLPQAYYISCRMIDIANLYFGFVNVTSHINFIRDAMNDVTTNMRTHVY